MDGLARRFAEVNASLVGQARVLSPIAWVVAHDQGKVIWPAAGDGADITFVDASCSAELIARRNDVKAVFHKGKPSVWKV